MCDQWQTIITSTLIRSLGHAPLTGGMLLIANTGTLNSGQPKPGPWTRPPGDHTSPSRSSIASAPTKSPLIKQIPVRRWQKYTGNSLSLPWLMASRHLVSYDRMLPVDNQSPTEVCTVESNWTWPNYIPQILYSMCDAYPFPSNPRFNMADKSTMSPPGHFCPLTSLQLYLSPIAIIADCHLLEFQHWRTEMSPSFLYVCTLLLKFNKIHLRRAAQEAQNRITNRVRIMGGWNTLIIAFQCC